MVAEPITLFSRTADPSGVARTLREKWPGVVIEGPDDAWTSATVSLGNRVVTFTHDPAYYAEPNWSMQMNGMVGHYSQFPDSECKKLAIMLPTSLKFSLGLLFEPEIVNSNDPRLEILFAITTFLDGVLFTTSALRDAKGRILFGMGDEDEEAADAVWPRVVAEVRIESATAPQQSITPDPVDRPTPSRVARRALALTAVTARAILEQGDIDLGFRTPEQNPIKRLLKWWGGQGDQHEMLLRWVTLVGVEDELEPDEWEVLQRPFGRLDQEQQINSTWRLEGLGVLAWALGRFKLPSHDKLVECHFLWKCLGMLDHSACKAVLVDPTLKHLSQLQAMRRRQLAINWRLTDFCLRHRAMDFIHITGTSFANYDRTWWFSPQEVADLPLVDGDLAIRGKRLDKAAQEDVLIAGSIARERHQAANWLCQGPEIYSDADVNT